MKNNIKKFIPKPIKKRLKSVIDFIEDIVDSLTLSLYRDTLTPPHKLRCRVGPFSGARYYRAVGEEFFQYFKDLGGLELNEDLLDVGCGCGQMAVPLTKYLGQSGTYEGFDIIGTMIEWCRKNISSKYPNFHFGLADLFNKMYNPKGKYKASEYKFPYRNESFDFVFAKSVFTHMLPQDMENYFSEIARVLKRGKRCLISFFLSNKESLKLINTGQSTLDFKCEFGKYRTVDPNTPEGAVCYDEAFILGLYEKYGLKIKQPIRYGSWCGRLNFLSYQDIIIASKEQISAR